MRLTDARRIVWGKDWKIKYGDRKIRLRGKETWSVAKKNKYIIFNVAI